MRLYLPVQRYDYTGNSGSRRADIGPSPSFILPTSDGYVGANVLTQAQWEMLCQFFGKPEFIADPLFADGWARMENSRDLATQLAEQTRPRTAEDVFHDAQTWRIPFGLIPTMAEVLNLLPHREREFFFDFEHPRAGSGADAGDSLDVRGLSGRLGHRRRCWGSTRRRFGRASGSGRGSPLSRFATAPLPSRERESEGESRDVPRRRWRGCG